MKWILAYCKEDIEKNKAYIDLYFTSCQKRGISLLLLTLEEIFAFFSEPSEKIDLVINRTRNWDLSVLLEKKGIPVSNSAKVTELGNHKLKAVYYIQKLGIPCMESALFDASFQRKKWEYPYVIKSVDGHGGSEVFRIMDDHERKAKEDLWKSEKWMAQKQCSDLGKDLRVYVVGNQIFAGMLRSSDVDFRSNYSLGGKATPVPVDSEVKEYVETILQKLPMDHCGIDFIYHEGHPVFNEIEDVVGSRMLYANTDRNIVEEYVEYLYSLRKVR